MATRLRNVRRAQTSTDEHDSTGGDLRRRAPPSRNTIRRTAPLASRLHRASAGDALYGEDERECSARGNLAESVARCMERRRGRFKSIATFVAHELQIQSDDEGVKYLSSLG